MRSFRVSYEGLDAKKSNLVVVAEVVDFLVWLQMEVVQYLIDVLLLRPQQIPVVFSNRSRIR